MIVKAIASLRPNAQFVMAGSSYEGLNWLDTVQDKPTESELDVEVIRLQAEEDANAYKALRAAEYPSLEELADALYWDANGDKVPLQSYFAKIKAVKDKHPKSQA